MLARGDSRLKVLKRNLFACLQEVTNSLRLFKVASSGLQMIKYFSHRHKLQQFEIGLKGVACFKIFQVIPNFNFASFKVLNLANLLVLISSTKSKRSLAAYAILACTVMTASGSPRQTELIKKDLCGIFSSYGLKITIEANKKAINFLDVTLNLSDGKYMAYTKPGNTIETPHST